MRQTADRGSRNTCATDQACVCILPEIAQPAGRNAMHSLRNVALAGLAIGLFAPPASAQTVKVGIILTYSGADLNLGSQTHRRLRPYMQAHAQAPPPGAQPA